MLTALALGVRLYRQPDPRPMEAQLVRLPRAPAEAPHRPPPAPSRSARPSPAPEAATPAPDQAAAKGPPPAPAEDGKLAREARPLNLGCFAIDLARLPAAEQARCRQTRWRPPGAGEPGPDLGPLAALEPAKQRDLDRTAAEQAACLDYKRARSMDPPPWGLRDAYRHLSC
jgi:hypothetical protein